MVVRNLPFLSRKQICKVQKSLPIVFGKWFAAYDWEHVASGLKITLSIGLAERTSEDTFKEILALADEKLYEAKQSGRNQVCA